VNYAITFHHPPKNVFLLIRERTPKIFHYHFFSEINAPKVLLFYLSKAKLSKEIWAATKEK
jgi:hypothetical protein